MVVFKESTRDVWLLVLVVLIALAANLPPEIAAAYSIDKTYLLMALTGIIAVAILRHLRFTLVVMTVVLAAGANLPVELAARFNIDASIMFFTLILMLVIAAVNRFLRVVPDQTSAENQNSVHGARALIKAISTGNAPQVHRIIQSGVNVNIATLDGKTPLMLAVFTGHAVIVQLLLAAGADTHTRDREGNTALMIAESRDYTRIRELLATRS